ncbi:PQ loop repeat-domain-containing protein [Russula earlei]|uniref:PQ loop repeat-domain-containing protein n=1 Tax=Russula earlei TaxID=71964 RepID=A0ACC0UEW1_9AGAM|nr:PQ loop repeat-domain-containing protein [Russula earlei]
MSLSDWSGFMSICFWLGAQFPQVIENARRQSVEGLALPFLANWLLGDLTNLIGCILTRQLPFQTLLASYFCVVDVALLSQYFYYRKTATPTVSAFTQPRSRAGSLAFHTSRVRAPSRYRTLSAAAANVASVAAALASQKNEPPASTYVQTRWSRRSLDGLLDNDPHRSSLVQHDDDDVDEDALAMLGDSIHSERSGRYRHVLRSKDTLPRAGHSRSGSRQGMASSTIPNSLQITSTIDDFSSLARGRSLQRTNLASIDSLGDYDWRHDEEGSQRRRSSRATRRGASLVFMGAWALFGIGTLGMPWPGRVLSSSSPATTGSLFPPPTQESPPLAAVNLVFDTPNGERITEDGRPPTRPPLERVIGRISAWTCTTLYLTSRLPQIWKNVFFVPNSLQGLSMYLFIFAFLGNFFYVVSILSSPNMRGPLVESSRYLRESMPYLLGSGGTLMFDVTIVTQSYLYRPEPRTRGPRAFSREVAAAEEEGLMRADSFEETYTSRRRLPVTAEETDSVRD